MTSNVWMGRLDNICQWTTRLAYANLLWLFFTCIGLFIFGFWPSTVALFSIIRKWLQGERDISAISYFWKTYKEEFGRANILGFSLIAITLILFFSWHVINSFQGALSPVLTGSLIGAILLFMIVILYVFPVFVHYEGRPFQYMKTAFLIGISYPFYTIAMVFSVIIFISICLFFTGVMMIFLGSGLGFSLMYLSNRVFHRIDMQTAES